MEDRYKIEDTSPHRCQCVMRHDDKGIDGTIPQCTGPRWVEGSNLFCKACEKEHGDALSKKVQS